MMIESRGLGASIALLSHRQPTCLRITYKLKKMFISENEGCLKSRLYIAIFLKKRLFDSAIGNFLFLRNLGNSRLQYP